MPDTTKTSAPVAALDNRAAFEADMHAINPGVCRAVLDIYWESTEGKLWRAAMGRSAAPAPAEHSYASTQATNCAACGEHKHTPLRIDAMGGYVCLTCIDRKLGSLLGEFGLIPLIRIGLPSPDEHDRVLVYTEGVDFAGQQYFDIKTEDLWEVDPEAKNEVAEAATHWMPRPRPGIVLTASRRTTGGDAEEVVDADHPIIEKLDELIFDATGDDSEDDPFTALRRLLSELMQLRSREAAALHDAEGAAYRAEEMAAAEYRSLAIPASVGAVQAGQVHPDSALRSVADTMDQAQLQAPGQQQKGQA